MNIHKDAVIISSNAEEMNKTINRISDFLQIMQGYQSQKEYIKTELASLKEALKYIENSANKIRLYTCSICGESSCQSDHK